MDAVQQANSGHPGTPMAMAPVAYALWQRHLRFDPDDPIWPERDRFVLSMGHASMLLYSMLHLTGVKAVNPKYETLGELSVTLDDIKRFRQLDSRCPGHPEYRWTSGVETTTGPLGQGVATSVGMAIAGEVAGRLLQPPRLPDVRLRHLRPRRRRLHDGGHLGRGGLARRAPAARQPVLDLRQQPHHDRGPDAPGLQRGRGHALHRLRLERHPRGRRQRPRDAGPGLHDLQEDAGPAHPHHRGQPHRLRRAHQAGHARGARRAAGRGGDPADQEVLRLAGGREVPGARRRARALREGHGRARRQGARPSGWRSSRATRRSIPGKPTRWTACSTGSSPRAGRRRIPTFPAGCQGPGRPRRVREGAERGGPEHPLAHRRLGRPGAVHQDAPHLRRARATSRPARTAGATSTSASASTRWARS